MNPDEELAMIKRWLADMHTTLWSTFDIGDDDGRTRAATWFQRQADSYLTFAETHR